MAENIVDMQMLWQMNDEITNRLNPICNKLNSLDLELPKIEKRLIRGQLTRLEREQLLEKRKQKLKTRGEKISEYISLLKERDENQKKMEELVGLIS